MPNHEAAAVRSVRANINPGLLVWARETAGLPRDAAAKKIGVKPARLAEWEEGRLRPTVTQLRKAASVYKRPLAVFFCRDLLLDRSRFMTFAVFREEGGVSSRPNFSLRCEERDGGVRWRLSCSTIPDAR